MGWANRASLVSERKGMIFQREGAKVRQDCLQTSAVEVEVEKGFFLRVFAPSC